MTLSSLLSAELSTLPCLSNQWIDLFNDTILAGRRPFLYAWRNYCYKIGKHQKLEKKKEVNQNEEINVISNSSSFCIRNDHSSFCS